ncbi:HAD family hydrolase [candidate division WOR-3 bacterium]|nr:HAD family hydrolase [candidate division WOR-3 bacterium]
MSEMFRIKTPFLAVFDMDGTLYRSDASFIPAVKSLLSNNGLEVPADDFLFSFIGEPDSVFIDWLAKLSSNGNADSLYNEFQRSELNMVRERGELYDGVLSLLDWLKENGFTLAVCSNATKVYIDTVLEKFRLTELFSAVRVPAGSESKKKMLKEISDQFSPEIGFMVGDRIHDMQAAFENGFAFIGALYGFGRKEIETAENCAESPFEIKPIFEKRLSDAKLQI